jgi:hypothetical protein
MRLTLPGRRSAEIRRMAVSLDPETAMRRISTANLWTTPAGTARRP